MSLKANLDDTHPLDQAERLSVQVAKSIANEMHDISRDLISPELIHGLFEISRQSRFDDSQLVIKQKIRMLIRQEIRTKQSD